jgi:PPOX class probable F420-dependent enzyme
VAFMTTVRPDGLLSTNPVAVVYDGTTIRVSTVADRRKVRNLLADDRVTLCVVQPGNLNRYVEIRGRAIVEPDEGRRFVDTMARQYMDVESAVRPAGDERAIDGRPRAGLARASGTRRPTGARTPRRRRARCDRGRPSLRTGRRSRG